MEWYRHLLVPAAFMAFAFSLRMRRFVWTLLGLGWFVAYLGWLAADVFRDTPFFPIILASVGGLLGLLLLVSQWRGTDAGMLDLPRRYGATQVASVVVLLVLLAAGTPL